ncbi:unnamed protein product [Dibothriocephalus latus]|uniref:Uncharacterized protein n=1 Tax=Dibothriocephalus latus TaxID=60516 RepID=A0A3P6RRY4_DIBLA|nr:unnamed protein product [Dibothriocephalus latus]
MRYLRLFLPFLLAALKTAGVVGFGFSDGSGHGNGYVQESAGGLLVNLHDQAERERINAEMEAITVTYGEDIEQLFTYFKSKDGQSSLNMSCGKSALVFEQKGSLHSVRCNLTYDLQRSIALSFEIDYPPVAYLAPAFWLHLQSTASSGPQTIHLNLTIQGVRMGVAYLRIWAREAIEKEKSGAGVYVWSRSDPLLVEAYLSRLANRSEVDGDSSVMGLPVKILRPRGPLEMAFNAVVACMVIAITCVMGCELDPRLIWRHLKKPMGPFIGFCCQFGIMPLVSIAV